MRVELIGQYWKGDHAVPKQDSQIMLCNGLLIDGEPVWCTKIRLDLESSIPLFDPDTGDACATDSVGDFVILWLENVYDEHAQRLMADPNNYAWGSTETNLGVVVSELSFRERYPHPEPEPVTA